MTSSLQKMILLQRLAANSGRFLFSQSGPCPPSAGQTSNSIRSLSSKAGKGRKKPVAKKRPRLGDSPSSTNLDGIWYSPSRPPSSKNLDMGKFGLKRLDYNTIEVPVWTVPPHPPTKSLADRILFPATLVITAGFALWVYMNPEEDDMKEYWQRVESGRVLIDDDDDDDEDDWDDDEDEEE